MAKGGVAGSEVKGDCVAGAVTDSDEMLGPPCFAARPTLLLLLLGAAHSAAGSLNARPQPKGAVPKPALWKPTLAVDNLKVNPSLARLRGGSGGISFAGASPFVLTCAGFAALDALLLGYDIGVV